MVPTDPIPAEVRLAAWELLLADWDPEDRRRQIAEFASQPIGESGDTFLGVVEDGQPRAVVWGQIQPGRVAAVWPPRAGRGIAPEVPRLLLGALCDRLPAHDVQLAQTLLAEDQQADAQLLLRAGFERLAVLSYMLSVERDFPRQRPDSELAFVPYAPALHATLAAVVEATYEQTCDCPRLNGLRSADDVLAGYQSTGAFDPSRWLLVYHAGQPVGCLLLADYPQHGHWELVYMGIVSGARGRGWGGQIARYAQWLCGQAGRPRLVLAVDASNGPALGMYEAVGFRAWEQRVAFVHLLNAPS